MIAAISAAATTLVEILWIPIALIVKILKHPLSQHPLVILFVGAAAAYFFTERWQRWRQRREFQYRAMTKFSELSATMLFRLSRHLAISAVHPVTNAQQGERFEELVLQDGQLASLDSEILAAFEDQSIRQEFTKFRRSMTQLSGMAVAVPRDTVPEKQSKPVYTAAGDQRQVLIEKMIREMRLAFGRGRKK